MVFIPDNEIYYSCPIWGASSDFDSQFKCEYNKDEGCYKVFSPRAGGTYRIKYETAKKLINTIEKKSSFNDIFRAKLTTWLIKQRKQGEKIPLITDEVLEKVKERGRLPIKDRVDNVLKYIQEEDNTKEFPRHILKAYSECADDDEWHGTIYDKLKQYVNIEGEYIGSQTLKITLNAEGLERLEALETNKDSRQVFVAMWFDDSMNDIYEQAIKPAIEETGYKSMRIDKKPHNNKIDDEIIAEIRRSKFLIADFSYGEDGIRGSVYYEAGFAHGLGIPVIFTCRASNQDKLHFDTRQFNHIIWKKEKPEELKKALQNRIRATIHHNPPG